MDDKPLKATDKLQKIIAGSPSVDKAIQSIASHLSVMDKAMAAMARPSAIDKALQSIASQQSARDKAMAAMARPSAIDQALRSITANQTSLEHAIKGFAKASSVILAEPSYLSEMAHVVSSIDLNSIDASSVEGGLEKIENEFGSVENRANFASVFSNLHPRIQAIFYYFLVLIFFPQVNSISANLLTPMVENYLESNEKPNRLKIKEIKKIPLTLSDVNTDALRFIKGNNLRLRASPSINSEIYDELILGQVVTVLSKQKNWIEVMYEYEDGESISGWVFTRYTEKFIK